MKKQITLIAAMILAGFAAFSQDQIRFHATTTTQVQKLIKLPDGSFTLLSGNRLFRVNTNGAIVWSKIIPTSEGKSFVGTSFVRLTDGSYIIAGYLDRSQV